MIHQPGTIGTGEVNWELSESTGAPVQLSVVQRADQLPIVRSLVERVLYLEDWIIDDVADVTIAVDEICSGIIAAAAPDERLSVTVTPRTDVVLAEISGTTEPGYEVDRAGFGWRMVKIVTDAQSIAYTDTRARRDVTVTFEKVRTEVDGAREAGGQ